MTATWESRASKGTATPYVLTRWVGSRATIAPTRNVPWRLLQEAYDRLPDDVRLKFDAYNAAAESAIVGVRAWAFEFIRAYEAGRDVPDMRGHLYPLGDRRGWNDRMVTLASVIDSGPTGVTVAEVKHRNGKTSNSISGYLTTLHEAGVLARLTERRPT